MVWARARSLAFPNSAPLNCFPPTTTSSKRSFTTLTRHQHQHRQSNKSPLICLMILSVSISRMADCLQQRISEIAGATITSQSAIATHQQHQALTPSHNNPHDSNTTRLMIHRVRRRHTCAYHSLATHNKPSRTHRQFGKTGYLAIQSNGDNSFNQEPTRLTRPLVDNSRCDAKAMHAFPIGNADHPERIGPVARLSASRRHHHEEAHKTD